MEKIKKLIKEKQLENFLESLVNRAIITVVVLGGLAILMYILIPHLGETIAITYLIVAFTLLFIFICGATIHFLAGKMWHPSEKRLKKWGDKLLPKIEKELQKAQETFEKIKKEKEDIENFSKSK